MDSGIAAILGAAVGALGSGGAAFVTGLWGARTTQRQLEAQDAQARRQLRVEHIRERREPRSTVYADFVAQARVIERATGRYRDSHTLDAEGFNQEVDRLDYLSVLVSLEGPEPLLVSSQAVVRCAHRFMKPLRHAIATHREYGDQSDEHAAAVSALATVGFEFIAVVKDFAEAARLVLDEAGVDPPTSPAQGGR
ncbi:hypothetical protein ACIGW3_09245 [Streptomyces sp. NPDC053499]|uniref:hypothetical protein n=1 Tax=Streptomyces sp. NPDC053499 TaxID=3365707 RepID=UPI0037CD2B6B